MSDREKTLKRVAERRLLIRGNLHELYLPFYDALCLELDKHEGGEYWAPIEGLRTFERQDELYAQGRTEKGFVVTHAKRGDSAHNWGCATDWVQFKPEFEGEDIWRESDWQMYGDAVRKVGLIWGGDWDNDGVTEKGEWDRPHNQMKIDVRWARVGDKYRDQGVDVAEAYLSDVARGGIS